MNRTALVSLLILCAGMTIPVTGELTWRGELGNIPVHSSDPISLTVMWKLELNITEQELQDFSYPILADLDGDGLQELVLLKETGTIFCVGPNATVMWQTDVGSLKENRIAAGDVDGDGRDEVAVLSDDGVLTLIDGGGDVLWQKATGNTFLTPPPVLEDIDGDGEAEIIALVAPDADMLIDVSVLEGDGTEKWRAHLDAEVSTTPTVTDIDGDGSPEIIFSYFKYTNFFFVQGDSTVVVMDNQGTTLWEFRSTDNGMIAGPVVVADLWGDKDLEVVFSTYKTWYVLDHKGNFLWELSGPSAPSILGDVNKDGMFEGVAVEKDTIYLVPVYGEALWSHDVKSGGHTQVVLLDVNNDRSLEIMTVGSSDQLLILDGDGRSIFELSFEDPVTSNPVAWDVDGDGTPEIAVVAGGWLIVLDGSDIGTEVYGQAFGPSAGRSFSPICVDGDSDMITDDLERIIGTDPNRKDTDGDGMTDGYEYMNWLDPFRDDSMGDADGDGMPNLFEYQNGLVASEDDSNADRDDDGMPNFYEYQNGLNASWDDAKEDKDDDGMPNLYESQHGLNASWDDSMEDADGDGMPNLYEYQHGLNVTVNDAYGDKDGDGMPNLYESQNGLDASRNDAYEDKDGDGMPNIYEYQNGLNASRNDALEDADGDGMSNLYEYKHGLNASRDDAMEDKDGDGIPNIYEARLFLSADNRADGIAMIATVVLSPLGLVPYIRKRVRKAHDQGQ